jgi:hypothetical protein
VICAQLKNDFNEFAGDADSASALSARCPEKRASKGFPVALYAAGVSCDASVKSVGSGHDSALLRGGCSSWLVSRSKTVRQLVACGAGS